MCHYICTVFAAVDSFAIGYNFAVVSGAMIVIKQEFHLPSFWQELLISVAIVTAILGALLGGFLNRRFGRKPVLLACAMVFTIGAVVEAVATSRNVLLSYSPLFLPYNFYDVSLENLVLDQLIIPY